MMCVRDKIKLLATAYNTGECVEVTAQYVEASVSYAACAKKHWNSNDARLTTIMSAWGITEEEALKALHTRLLEAITRQRDVTKRDVEQHRSNLAWLENRLVETNDVLERGQ